jgi:hypothetical protein
VLDPPPAVRVWHPPTCFLPPAGPSPQLTTGQAPLLPADPEAGDVNDNAQQATCAAAPLSAPPPAATYTLGAPVVANYPAGRANFSVPLPAVSAECVDTLPLGFLTRVPHSLRVGALGLALLLTRTWCDPQQLTQATWVPECGGWCRQMRVASRRSQRPRPPRAQQLAPASRPHPSPASPPPWARAGRVIDPPVTFP